MSRPARARGNATHRAALRHPPHRTRARLHHDTNSAVQSAHAHCPLRAPRRTSHARRPAPRAPRGSNLCASPPPKSSETTPDQPPPRGARTREKTHANRAGNAARNSASSPPAATSARRTCSPCSPSRRNKKTPHATPEPPNESPATATATTPAQATRDCTAGVGLRGRIDHQTS